MDINPITNELIEIILMDVTRLIILNRYSNPSTTSQVYCTMENLMGFIFSQLAVDDEL
jgi:hypothetical protein